MLQEIAALAAICLTLAVVALGCEKQRRPPAGARRARVTEPDEPLISNKLELPSSRTGGGSKGPSQSKKSKKDSKTAKQRTKASKTPQLQRPPPPDVPSAPEKKKPRFMRNEMPPIPSSVNQDEPEDTPVQPEPAPEVAPQMDATPMAEPAPAPMPEVTAQGTGEAAAAAAAGAGAPEGENEPEKAEGVKKDEEEEKDSGEEKTKKKKKHKKKHKKKKHKKHHKKSDDDDEEEEPKKKSKRHHKKKKKHRKTPIDHATPEAPGNEKPGETKFENYPAASPAAPTPDGGQESPGPEESPAVPDDPNAPPPVSPAAETPPVQPDQQQLQVVAAGSAAGTAADRMNELIAKNEAAAAAAGGQPGAAAGEAQTKDDFITGIPEDVRLALERKFAAEAAKGKRPVSDPAPTDAAPQPTGGPTELVKVPSCGKTGEVVAAAKAASAEKKYSVTDLEPKQPTKKVPSTELLTPPPPNAASPSQPPGKSNKPKVIPRDIKAERITKLGLKRGKEAYPTMNDVVSDWDSKEEAAPGPAEPTPEQAAEIARLAKEAAKKAEEEEAREAKRYNEEQEMKLRKEEEAASERHRKKPKNPASAAPPNTPPPGPAPSPAATTPAISPGKSGNKNSKNSGENEENMTPEKRAEFNRVRDLRKTKPMPKPIKRNSWEEKLATGQVVRPKNEYPTFGDIVSDWETAADDKPEGNGAKKQKKKK